MSEEDLRVGIVGFGLRAGLWRYLERPGEGSRVSVVCDTSERGRADAAAKLPGAKVTESLAELIAEGVDAVVVLVPDFAHAEVVIPLLEASIPVFCEKPLEISLEAADAILETAYRTKTRLYLGHNMRHMPVIRQLREVIQSGRIGEVKAIWCRHFVGNGGDYYFKDWHAQQAKVNSLLLQKGAHDIDVIHWLAGGYTRQVSAIGSLSVYGGVASRRDNTDRRMADWFSKDNWPPTAQTELNPAIDVEDLSMMQMVLDNGVLASYQQCMFTPDYWRNYTVIGTAGRIENYGDGPGGTIKVWTSRSISGLPEADETLEIAGDDEGHGGADPALIAEFLRFARSGGVTETSPIAARQAVAAGVLAAQSLRSDGGARQVPELPADLVAYFEGGQR
ncbi:Gfo/Idh/MocA family protein [Psychromicrobium sp. YIM B11713]|uniref:Gfo/Idh/MocA family protein n=1 Tax=Psychromicrobium sp. YIM B11713 TaxID=3145233 RepID=UPI00374E824E